MKAKRPWRFFDRNNASLPDEVQLRFVRLPEFAELSEQQRRDKVTAAVQKREAELSRQSWHQTRHA